MTEKKEMVRVNTRISEKTNEWLDRQSNESGIPKSTLILLAIENYIQQKDAMTMMNDFSSVIERLEKLQETMERNGSTE